MRKRSLAAPDRFVPLAELLREAPSIEEPPRVEPGIEEGPRDDQEHALRQARLFRAHLCDALENAVGELLTDIAAEVLARELQLAPAEIGAIVRQVLQTHCASDPVRVRVHPEDAAVAACELPVVCDDGLRRGDAIVELRDGALEASLGVRLEAVLRNLAG